MAHLVLDIGNFRIKGAFFSQNDLEGRFDFPVSEYGTLRALLKRRTFESSLILSVNPPIEEKVRALFLEEKMPYQLLDPKKIKIRLDVDEPQQLGQDRIANAYGALVHFPVSDCIIVDIGAAVTFDFVRKEGSYSGGAIYPGPEIGAKGLVEFASKLPLVPFEKPAEPIAKTTAAHIQSGLYWGLLGAIERIVDEMRLETASPSSIKVIATGGKTRIDETDVEPKSAFIEDLKELVDLIDPDLTLKGIYEILKEQKGA